MKNTLENKLHTYILRPSVCECESLIIIVRIWIVIIFIIMYALFRYNTKCENIIFSLK